MKASDLDDLITQAEAARLRGVTREAIYDLVARGRLQAIEIGGQRFVRKSEVIGFESLPAGRPPRSTKRKTKEGKSGSKPKKAKP
jgi:excisionase family DNA binding protein